MFGGRSKSLLTYLVPIAVVLVIGARYLQLQVVLALAALNLFWGYLEAAAILLLVIAALVLKPIRWPAFMVAIVLAIDLVLPAARDFAFNSGPAKGPTLRVISYNWLGDNTDRSESYRWLAEQSADIVAIQEYSPLEPGAAAGLATIFPYQTKPAPDLVILSRYPFVWERARLVEEHSIVTATLDIKGRRLTVWGVHPATLRTSWDLAARNHYLTTLAELIAHSRGPAVMLGDFNATRWDPYFSAVVRRGRLHEEARLFPLATRMGLRTGLAFLGSPIDHILTNGSNVLSNCHTGPAMGSDHLPLICDLTLGD